MIIFYPLFFLVSILFPRKKNLWVFGCHDGYLDNTRYFFEFSSSQKEYQCFWLANTLEELVQVKNDGRSAVLKKSVRGYWISARAGFSFICTGFSDVNRLLALRSTVINFWHGTPIKKIYLDSTHDLNRFGNRVYLRAIAKFLMKLLNANVDFYYASNTFELNLVARAAGFKLEKTTALGSPRYDGIRSPRKIDALIDLKNRYKSIILYAPTWREGGVWNDNFLLDERTFYELNKSLYEMNSILLIKPHPLTNISELISLGLQRSSHIVYTSDIEVKDINSIYAYADVLVTDVSSSMFDYLIFSRPVLIFMPDISDYLSGDRGIYDDFKKTLLNNAIRNWNDFLKVLKSDASHKIEDLEDISKEVCHMTSTNKAIYQDLKMRFLNQ